MTLTETYRQALTAISELPTDSKTWQEYANDNRPLDWINVNKAKALAVYALETPADDNREHIGLVMLRNHFNSVNKYPAEEKIRVGMLIIESGLKDDKQDYSKQLKLEF